jgi:hypothetical protein
VHAADGAKHRAACGRALHAQSGTMACVEALNSTHGVKPQHEASHSTQGEQQRAAESSREQQRAAESSREQQAHRRVGLEAEEQVAAAACSHEHGKRGKVDASAANACSCERAVAHHSGVAYSTPQTRAPPSSWPMDSRVSAGSPPCAGDANASTPPASTPEWPSGTSCRGTPLGVSSPATAAAPPAAGIASAAASTGAYLCSTTSSPSCTRMQSMHCACYATWHGRSIRILVINHLIIHNDLLGGASSGHVVSFQRS